MRKKWKEVVGFEGYQVSDTGEVRSFINNRHGVGTKSHILKPTPNKHGYDTVCLGRGNRKLVHRLVADAYVPNPDGLPLVRHLDDNPKNNSCGNLAWGTQTDNMQDCVKHGRLVGDTRAAIASRKKEVIATSLDGSCSMIFESVQGAARVLDVWPQHICSVIQGKIRQTGGWTFRYTGGDDDYV